MAMGSSRLNSFALHFNRNCNYVMRRNKKIVPEDHRTASAARSKSVMKVVPAFIWLIDLSTILIPAEPFRQGLSNICTSEEYESWRMLVWGSFINILKLSLWEPKLGALKYHPSGKEKGNLGGSTTGTWKNARSTMHLLINYYKDLEYRFLTYQIDQFEKQGKAPGSPCSSTPE